MIPIQAMGGERDKAIVTGHSRNTKLQGSPWSSEVLRNMEIFSTCSSCFKCSMGEEKLATLLILALPHCTYRGTSRHLVDIQANWDLRKEMIPSSASGFT